MVVNFTAKQSFSTKTGQLDLWAAGVISIMNNRVKNNRSRFPILVAGMVLAFLCGCSGSGSNQSMEDKSYLTPIPESTLSAYRSEMPITNKLEAVIAAQMFMRTTRLEYEETPSVVSVDELTLDEAHRRVRDPQSGNYYYEDRPGNTIVWLVVLEGNYRIIPPVADYTPEPFGRGCAYVIIDQDGGGEMTTFACSE
jgi:hypothetical protein